MCGLGGAGATPAAPRIEPLKQAAPDDAAARGNTMRRLLRRYAINRGNLTGGLDPATSLQPSNTRASLPGALPNSGKSLLGQ